MWPEQWIVKTSTSWWELSWHLDITNSIALIPSRSMHSQPSVLLWEQVTFFTWRCVHHSISMSQQEEKDLSPRWEARTSMASSHWLLPCQPQRGSNRGISEEVHQLLPLWAPRRRDQFDQHPNQLIHRLGHFRNQAFYNYMYLTNTLLQSWYQDFRHLSLVVCV